METGGLGLFAVLEFKLYLLILSVYYSGGTVEDRLRNFFHNGIIRN